MDALGYYNGKWGPLDEMTVPMNDRACFFGDGVYDAAICYKKIIYLLDNHVDRFFNSAAFLEIKPDFSKDELKSILKDLAAKVDLDEVLVYWQLTRGTGRRNHAFPEGKPNLWVIIKAAKVADLDHKIKLITIEDTRFLHCNVKTLNLIPNVIAAQRAHEAGAHEAVFHRGNIVTECAHSNVHIIKDGKFITHPTDNLILRGIARGHLAQVCDRLGIPVEEREFTLDELFNADEILTSSTSTFGLSANSIDGKPAGGKAPELLRKIHDEIRADFSKATGYPKK
ncbi:aminotransferase class IV [Leadbettera azotonutricia]|uniref:D-amino-acid transaminase n=1 Tax=Leadbettera azotonutricia (strain ATCC BAA-888 / DSM 13862 / ZAS-9) TaxID=545695 RepID=F5YAA5_LEAAZ|nr:aminotransferase class IV [Leadbettera azotonutricia]AEF82067.1 D-amino-acid transaminase [Leadbettera azotonutricia ZAS-9]